ncbi:putative DNA-binding transcriptional regulator AlpA [Arthrobacter stackebrandtii]|uniref:DNA-binding transcriptional regulator AlpA n=1 Tax=Arthrobacter stackebrandtii TaxID=272161 RepID=A0ABS4YZ71_9MICC|nr:putative DNA-binding transcriptional regulator AlpA [Arthrobacter stackebrandtii]
MSNSEYLSRRQAADYLGLSVGWMATTGRACVPSYRVGGVMRYRRDELDAWVDSQRVARP